MNFRTIILLFIFYFLTMPSFAESVKIDKLKKKLKQEKVDTLYIDDLIKLSIEYNTIHDSTNALHYGRLALQESNKRNLKHYFGDAYECIGIVFLDNKEYKKALDIFFIALKIYEEINDKGGLANSYSNIGDIKYAEPNYSLALNYYKKCLNICDEMNYEELSERIFNSLGATYTQLQNYPEAIQANYKCLNLSIQRNDKQSIAYAYNNIGELYYKHKDYASAFTNYFQSLVIAKKISDQQGITNGYFNIGNTYNTLNKLDSAKSYLDSALFLSAKINDQEGVMLAEEALANYFDKKHIYDEALTHYRIFFNLKDSLRKVLRNELTAEMYAKFETEKKDKNLIKKDLEISIQKAELSKENTVRNTLVFGILLLVVSSYLLFKNYKKQKKSNLHLDVKNKRIIFQNQEIEKRNSSITSSIQYAQNIQYAILPDRSEISKFFESYFILNKPRDIVSGDFYWLKETENHIYFAIADCTGHGVPGAFMTFIGYNLLENIVGNNSNLKSAEILEILNDQILTSLKQKDETQISKYGMEIGIITFLKRSNEINFAGAHNSLLISRANELIELKGDRKSIGIQRNQLQCGFTNHRFNLDQNDTIYAFSDGYAEQNGGEKNKKFYIQNFKKLLDAVSNLDLKEQKTILDKKFLQWKGNHSQLDDVLVMGFKIKMQNYNA